MLYHRKQARIVRRAVLVIVIAVAVVGHKCDGLLRAALEQAADGVPVGIWYIYRPSYSPSGGVLLVPVGPREHGEPAGVAVLVLPSVGNNAILILMSEDAAAEDTYAVEVSPACMIEDMRRSSRLYLLT